MKYTVNIMPRRISRYDMYSVRVEADDEEDAVMQARKSIEWATSGFALDVQSVVKGHKP